MVSKHDTSLVLGLVPSSTSWLEPYAPCIQQILPFVQSTIAEIEGYVHNDSDHASSCSETYACHLLATVTNLTFLAETKG